MIEGTKTTGRPEHERPDDARPRGPVAHEEIDIGEEPNATTNSGATSTVGGGSGDS